MLSVGAWNSCCRRRSMQSLLVLFPRHVLEISEAPLASDEGKDIQVYAACRGSGGIARLVLNRGTRWRQMVSLSPRSLYRRGNSLRYPFTYIMDTSFTKLRLPPQSLLHCKHTLSIFAWDAVCLSCKTLCRNVVAFHARRVSARRRLQKGILGVQPSEGWKDGSRRVQNRDCSPRCCSCLLCAQADVWSDVVMQDETWFIFLFALALKISCNVLWTDCGIYQDSFAIPEDSSHDFTRSSLHLEFFVLACRRLMMPFHSLYFRQWVIMMDQGFITGNCCRPKGICVFLTALEKLCAGVFGAVFCSTVSILGTHLA